MRSSVDRLAIYKAIIFDVGETLVKRDPSASDVLMTRCILAGIQLDGETARIAWKCAELWAGEQGLRELAGSPRMPDEEFISAMDFIAIQAAFPGKSEDEIKYLATTINPIPAPQQSWRVVDQIVRTLGELSAQGFKLGIVSNFNSSLPLLLEEWGLASFFHDVVVSSIVGFEKPDHRIFEVSCHNLGIKPHEALYVGDHPYDILSACNAGMDVAWICDDSDTLPSNFTHKPTFCLTSLNELVDTTGVERVTCSTKYCVR